MSPLVITYTTVFGATGYETGYFLRLNIVKDWPTNKRIYKSLKYHRIRITITEFPNKLINHADRSTYVDYY